MPSKHAWPEQKQLAVSITVLIETWTEGRAPPYSVQTTQLKPGTIDNSAITWAQYGGNEGVWRLLRILNHFGIPATFAINAKCAELYPEVVKEIVATGHEIAAHGLYQDQLHVYMQRDEERDAIRKSLDLIQAKSGRRPNGWVCPVHAWGPNTVELLAEEGLNWHGEVNYTSLPRLQPAAGRTIVALPFGDFADNRVLRGNPKDFHDVFVNTFDFLQKFEPMAMLPMTLHSHWGGRALMSAMAFGIFEHFKKADNVWFARSNDIAEWTRHQGIADTAYRERFF